MPPSNFLATGNQQNMPQYQGFGQGASQYGGAPAGSQPGMTRGFFGDLFNTVLQPVGIKPFPGGPYPDAGHLDQAQNAINTNTPITNLGALGGLPQIYSSLARQSGLPDPFADMAKSQWAQNNPAQGNPGQAPQLASNEWFQQPYTPSQSLTDLSDPTQRLLNQEQSGIAGNAQAGWSRVKASLAARGLSDQIPAMEAYYHQNAANQGTQAENQVRASEADRKTQLSQYLASALTQLYNAQRQHSLDQSGIFQNQGALSAAESNNTMNFYKNLLAPFAAQGASSLFGGSGGGINSGGNGSGYRTNADGTPAMYGPSGTTAGDVFTGIF